MRWAENIKTFETLKQYTGCLETAYEGLVKKYHELIATQSPEQEWLEELRDLRRTRSRQITEEIDRVLLEIKPKFLPRRIMGRKNFAGSRTLNGADVAKDHWRVNHSSAQAYGALISIPFLIASVAFAAVQKPSSKTIEIGHGVTAELKETSATPEGDLEASLKLQGTKLSKTEWNFYLNTVGGTAGWEISKKLLPGGVRLLFLMGSYNPRFVFLRPLGILEIPGQQGFLDREKGIFISLVNSEPDGSSIVVVDLSKFKVLLNKKEESADHPLLDPEFSYNLAKTKDGKIYIAEADKNESVSSLTEAHPRYLVLSLDKGTISPYQTDREFTGHKGSQLVPRFGGKQGNWIPLSEWK